MGKTHIAIALLVALVIYTIFPLNRAYSFTFVLIATIIGGVFPDIDHPRNYIPGKKFTFFEKILVLIIPHRGITHSFFGAVLFSSLSIILLNQWNINSNYIFFFFMGYISHLLADSLTPAGIMWLYPFSRKRLGMGVIPTGSISEKLFFLLTILSLLTLIVLVRNR